MYLGDFYKKGYAVEKDPAKSKRHYSTARNNYKRFCENKSVTACLKLVDIYDTGRGVVKNKRKAEDFTAKAIKRIQEICTGERLSDRQVKECHEFDISKDSYLLRKRKFSI